MPRNDRLVYTTTDRSIQVRTADDRIYEIIRVSPDYMPLQVVGERQAAIARAEEIAAAR